MLRDIKTHVRNACYKTSRKISYAELGFARQRKITKSQMNKVLIFIFVTLCMIGCNLNNEQENNDFLYIDQTVHDKDGRLIKEGRLTYSNKPIGAEVEYNPENGDIVKWKFYDTNYIHPLVVVYYENKKFIGFKGNPFLYGSQFKGKTVVTMINPPNVKYLMGYRDFKDGTMVNEQAYEPGITEGRATVVLKYHKFEEGHTYFVYYYFMNEKGKIQDSAYIELLR